MASVNKKPSQATLFANVAAVIAAADLSMLYGEEVYEAHCQDEAVMGLMERVRDEIADRLAPASTPRAEDRASPDQAVRPAPRPRPEAIDVLRCRIANALACLAQQNINHAIDVLEGRCWQCSHQTPEPYEAAASAAQTAGPPPSGGPAVPQEGHTALEFQQHLALTAIAALRERLREAEALNFDLRLKVRGLQESESDSMKDVTVAKKERDAALARAERAEGALRRVADHGGAATCMWGSQSLREIARDALGAGG